MFLPRNLRRAARALNLAHSFLSLIFFSLVLACFYAAALLAHVAANGRGKMDAVDKVHCGEHALDLNQACLRLVADSDHDDIKFDLYAQSEECYKCDPWLVWTGYPSLDNSRNFVPVNASWPTFLRSSLPQTQDYDCALKYHFGEFGVYHMDIEKCDIVIAKDPDSTFLPIFYSFLALLILKVSSRAL